MALSRRSFLRITTAASGAAALGLTWPRARTDVGAWNRAEIGVGGAIAVVGAGADTEYGRGALLGMEESDRSAELLRRARPTVAVPIPGGLPRAAWLRELRDGGVRAVVSALPEESQRELERAAVAEGLIAMDARAVHAAAATAGAGEAAGEGAGEAAGEAAGEGAVFRSGVPSTAYSLLLLRALARADPEWRWAMIAESADRDGSDWGNGSWMLDRRLARAALGDGRVDAIRELSPGALPLADPLAGEHDALVWVGGRAGDGVVEDVAAGRPWVRIDRQSHRVHPPVAGLRVALWDPALFRYGAEQLNHRYRRRFGTGMTAEAWAGWMAVKAVAEAVLRSGTGTGTEAGTEPGTGTGVGAWQRRDLVDLVGGERAAFDGHKGAPLSFRAWGGALAQPLYVVGCGSTRQVEWPMTEAADDK